MQKVMGKTPSHSNIVSGLLTHYDLALLERKGSGRFTTVGSAPEWFLGYFGNNGQELRVENASLFLESFLGEAEDHWTSGTGRLSSGAWTEAGADGFERTLEATALRLREHKLLLIGPPTLRLDDVQRLLQTARDEQLARERERMEVEQREVLLHCIVHDLSNPLSGLKGSLQLLGEDDLEVEDGQQLLAIANRQVDRMQGQIRTVLDAFKAEVARQLPYAGVADPPDISSCPREVIESLQATAKLSAVTIDADLPESSVHVVGDRAKFQRVLFNLLGNALRYAPPGTTIKVAGNVDGNDAEVSVEDRGPGVPPELVNTLFKRFGKGPDGQTGLGLYFCRITAEQWGGSVGYEAAEIGGARFWIRLPLRS